MFFPATGRACSSGSMESSDPKLLISGADAIGRAVAVTYNGAYLDDRGSGKYFYSPLIEF